MPLEAVSKTLLQACRSWFDPSSISRGEQYYFDGSARFKGVEEGIATFQVSGSRSGGYAVHIDLARLAEGKLPLFCSCPHYADGFFCKHLWASLLTLENSSFKSNFAISGKLELVHLHLGDSEFDEEDEESYESVYETTYEKYGARGTSSKLGWGDLLDLVLDPLSSQLKSTGTTGSKEALYVLNIEKTLKSFQGVSFDLWSRSARGLVPLKESRLELGAFHDPLDRELLSILLSNPAYSSRDRFATEAIIPNPAAEGILKKMCSAQRLYVLPLGSGSSFLEKTSPHFWDENVWDFKFQVEQSDSTHYRLNGLFESAGSRMRMDQLLCIISPDLLIFGDRVAKLRRQDLFRTIASLRKSEALKIPKEDGLALSRKLLESPNSPEVVFPEELQWSEVEALPVVRLRVRSEISWKSGSSRAPRPRFRFDLSFRYGGVWLEEDDGRTKVLDESSRQVILRDREKEELCIQERSLLANDADPQKLITAALAQGWQVEAEGRSIRSSTSVQARVESGIDWFEFSGSVQYDNVSVQVRELLDAVEKGERWVQLDDGTYGLLPEKWVKSLSFLGQSGSLQKSGKLRFSSSQGILLDALLTSNQDIELEADKRFNEFSKRLSNFRGLKKLKEPIGFHGKLRPYQKDGLGWLEFLSEFGLGGILADDMGLGKTVQVLAFLQSRKATPGRPPSLVIAPKSLIHNWMSEAAKFSPDLRVLHYTGALRGQSPKTLVGSCDLLLMTYQSVRIDFEKFRDFEFDCVIADEAQAIKNSQALISQACRGVRAKYRLAMTGTPVENSVDDLFSILEFSDPGLLAPALKRKFQATKESDQPLAILAKAIRPVILRRTKEQVLKDLPEKNEQTLLCELPGDQLRDYQIFRDQLRASLDEKIDREGMAKSRIQILTALLRLRQLACHPGLVDLRKSSAPSAKLDLLVEQLKKVLGENHRALVFSQFTRFLDIVAKRLKKEGISYEYLDGKTRDRKAVVERFQSDAGAGVFLLSLKAGGTGLNLTAAHYVFLLDPWWNPAVEAQAIDRTHRIGQKNKVFAYRLVAKGTIEEKILELQSSKKEIAEALIQENQAFLRKMTREDLEGLLS